MIESANIDILHRRPLQRNLFLDIKQSTASLRLDDGDDEASDPLRASLVATRGTRVIYSPVH